MYLKISPTNVDRISVALDDQGAALTDLKASKFPAIVWILCYEAPYYKQVWLHDCIMKDARHHESDKLYSNDISMAIYLLQGEC